MKLIIAVKTVDPLKLSHLNKNVSIFLFRKRATKSSKLRLMKRDLMRLKIAEMDTKVMISFSIIKMMRMTSLLASPKEIQQKKMGTKMICLLDFLQKMKRWLKVKKK